MNVFEWVEMAYKILVENKEVPKMEKKLDDGKVSVYRVADIIRIDINRKETHR